MKDLYCAYYTNSEDITNYMVKRLGISDSDIILEPSAGEGIFVDSIIKENKAVHIDALDINEQAVSILMKKYANNESITVRQTDTLFDEQLDAYGNSSLFVKKTDTLLDQQLDLFHLTDGYYTKVIGNPPYGAWQDYEKRDFLKRKYPGQYVKETYSLFLLRCMSVLKIHGRLTFIIPDTFLFLNMHKRLREVLLRRSKIEEILIFPSKFFPGVSFGYSNLSIITLERCSEEEALNNEIRIIEGFRSPSEFSDILEKKYSSNNTVHQLRQKDILMMPDHRFVLSEEKQSCMIAESERKLGDVANVVTGFYCGDNKRFIKARDNTVKGSKNYEIVKPELIFECTSLSGIQNVSEGYIPFVKSSSKEKYLREKDDWYIRWDEETIRYYNSNKKSRFQNSQFYFKRGIAIPMVKSSKINATLMDSRVFDQSIVGIFPINSEDLYYLLALMNSEVINKLIHIINPTANNSANYIKLIPYIEPDNAEKAEITGMVKELIDMKSFNKNDEAKLLQELINKKIDSIYS